MKMLIFGLIFSVSAFAQTDGYLEISKIHQHVVSIIETSPKLSISENLEQLSKSENPLSIADLLIKAWEIVKDGQPVVNVQHKNVTALPVIANQNWSALTGWKSERVVTYNITTENAYGMKTVDLEFQVHLIYGGSYQGKGKYIASARVVPTKVDVLWGYNLDVNVDVPAILNVGAENDPVAAIQIDVNYRVSTVLRNYSESETFDLRGNGFFKNTKTGEVFFN